MAGRHRAAMSRRAPTAGGNALVEAALGRNSLQLDSLGAPATMHCYAPFALRYLRLAHTSLPVLVAGCCERTTLEGEEVVTQCAARGGGAGGDNIGRAERPRLSRLLLCSHGSGQRLSQSVLGRAGARAASERRAERAAAQADRMLACGQAEVVKELSDVLPADMAALLRVLEGLEAVVALRRSNRGQFVLFRGDKAGIEAAAKRTLKVWSACACRLR